MSCHTLTHGRKLRFVNVDDATTALLLEILRYNETCIARVYLTHDEARSIGEELIELADQLQDYAENQP